MVRTEKRRNHRAFGASSFEGVRVNPNMLVVVGYDTKDGPEHVLYDKRVKLPLDEGMVRNIMTMGVREPVIIKRDGERALVVDGRQRVLHAREANRRLAEKGAPEILVPVMPPSKDDDDGMYALMISLNAVRRNDSFADNAEKALFLYNKRGWSAERIADAFGVSAENVKAQWLAWNDVAPEVKAEVSAGTLAETAAVNLAKHLTREEQVTTVKKAKKAGKRMTCSDVQATLRERDGKRPCVPRRLIKKVLASPKAEQLPPGFVDGVMWTLGELTKLPAPLKAILIEVGSAV